MSDERFTDTPGFIDLTAATSAAKASGFGNGESFEDFRAGWTCKMNGNTCPDSESEAFKAGYAAYKDTK